MIENKIGCVQHDCEACQTQAAELRRLAAENEALLKDAARYRWLVNNCGLGIRKNGVHELTIAFYKDMPDSMGDLDAAIDAAKEHS